MCKFYPVRGLLALVSVIGVVACETARGANPVSPSSTIGTDAAAVSQPAAQVITRIDAPSAMAPAGRLNHNNPDFIVANGTVEGAGEVSFQFEVSRTADFSDVVAVVTVPLNDAGNT